MFHLPAILRRSNPVTKTETDFHDTLSQSINEMRARQQPCAATQSPLNVKGPRSTNYDYSDNKDSQSTTNTEEKDKLSEYLPPLIIEFELNDPLDNDSVLGKGTAKIRAHQITLDGLARLRTTASYRDWPYKKAETERRDRSCTSRRYRKRTEEEEYDDSDDDYDDSGDEDCLCEDEERVNEKRIGTGIKTRSKSAREKALTKALMRVVEIINL